MLRRLYDCRIEITALMRAIKRRSSHSNVTRAPDARFDVCVWRQDGDVWRVNAMALQDSGGDFNVVEIDA
ncbi:hypothetical protein QIH80_42235 [Bradyrhizobium elkanii]|nr:hypothetical protein QIH80_42235 [Bradyrhizobium elkanii]